MLIYNKNILVKNIYYLCKKKNIMIGNLEREVLGESAVGFFSRLRKEENDKKISIEAISLIANKFDISLDVLISIDLSDLTETETYLINFINRLISKTNNREINWFSETVYQIMQGKSLLDAGTHPLINKYKNGYYDGQFYLNGEEVYPQKIYYCITSSSVFYFVNEMVSKNKFRFNAFELYSYKNRELSKICYSSEVDQNCFFDLFKNLNDSVERYLKSPQINDNAKNAIDDFMEDLPF